MTAMVEEQNALHFMAAVVEKHQLKMVIRFKHLLDKTLLANGLTNRILNAKSGLKNTCGSGYMS